MDPQPRIALLIPCHNEAATVAKVVDDFRAQLEGADIYVFDNCSTDDTATVAREHGAVVVFEPRLGKGYVVEAMRARRLNLGGEQSGHVLFLDHNTTGDGILSTLRLLSVMLREGRSLTDLTDVVRD